MPNPTSPDITSKEYEDQAILKDMKLEARKQLREIETTTLKELGEEGWTLRSVGAILVPGSMMTGEIHQPLLLLENTLSFV
jgi:hypothetical protein